MYKYKVNKEYVLEVRIKFYIKYSYDTVFVRYCIILWLRYNVLVNYRENLKTNF